MTDKETKSAGTIGFICNIVNRTVQAIIPETKENEEVTSTIVFNTVVNNINKKKEV